MHLLDDKWADYYPSKGGYDLYNLTNTTIVTGILKKIFKKYYYFKHLKSKKKTVPIMINKKKIKQNKIRTATKQSISYNISPHNRTSRKYHQHLN